MSRERSVLTGLLALLAPLSASALTPITATATVNVRSGPGSAFPLLGRVPAGHGYVGILRNGAWWKFWFDGRTAYTPAVSWRTDATTTGVSVTTDNLNVRSGPGTSYPIVGHASRNQVYRRDATNNGWHRFPFGGRKRWARAAYLLLLPLPAPPPPASDGFSRTVKDGWGEADVGGAYALAGPAADFDATGSVGTMTLPAGGANRASSLPGVSLRDVSVVFRARTDRAADGGGQYLYANVRRSADGSAGYRLKLRFIAGGGVAVGAGAVVGNRESPIGGEAAAAGPARGAGTFFFLRAEATGAWPTQIRLRAWADGTPEPSAWLLTTTDDTPELQVPGGVGLQAYLSSSATAPVVAAFDDFRVTAAAAPAVPANAVYVASGGNDANPGTAALPWRTLQRAADAVAPGGTVVIRKGTYDGFFLGRSGTAAAPIAFMAYPGEAAVVDGNPANVNTILVRNARHLSLLNLVIRGSKGGQSAGIRLENGCDHVRIAGCVVGDNEGTGVKIYRGTYVTVEDNEVCRNATGIDVSYDGAGCVIRNNRVHHTDKMVRNTADVAHDDYGGDGITFTRTAGPVTATGNRVWSNRAKSFDYGWDGGAFSIYAASRVAIEDNVMWDNENVLETGTDNRNPCDGNRFVRNVAYGALSAPGGRLYGMFLRAAENMLVAHNTFHDLEWVFSVMAIPETFKGSIEGLRIVNNVASARVKVWGIEGSVPASVVIDRNLSFNPTGGWIGSVSGKGHTNSLAQFTAWCGYEKTGVQADPRFVDAAASDFRPAADSPAVDRGIVLPGVNDGWRGAGPDLGRFER